jgi:hypothetical protein
MGSPRLADLAVIEGSPSPGNDTTPPTAFRTASRRIAPPAQRTPSPKTSPAGKFTFPWMKIESAAGSSPDAWRTIVSGFVAPEASSTAPAGFRELAQPWPVAPVFPHGHAVASDPSPKQ